MEKQLVKALVALAKRGCKSKDEEDGIDAIGDALLAKTAKVAKPDAKKKAKKKSGFKR